ncbi:nucleotidyltransferase domain-containing protein [Lapidilactobacillus mulanensis]|uniref:Nucleotidyltransferase domain-containing protein n=1 Tax=Lapidilactobacillus mulanensis TaxID=2485999 RepID=A0ABW4DLA2_9LACO|nr:lincosamide nucleotidyltransferase Lnu(A) [Lapidilactobacillus mulanensis]
MDNHVEQVSEETLFHILDLFEEVATPFWLDGGWGVDVVTGRQHQSHRNVDIDFNARYTETVVSKLKALGYVVEVDWMPARMELKHGKYGYLGIHPIAFNADGSVTQANPQGGKFIFQKEWFTSTDYQDRGIPCVSKEAQLIFH